MSPPKTQTTHERSLEFPADLRKTREEIRQLHLVPRKPTPTESAGQYQSVEDLKGALKSLYGKKFMLDCGHRVTFGHFLGNDIVIRNGKRLEIVCSDCGS